MAKPQTLKITCPDPITVESPDGKSVAVSYPPAHISGGKSPYFITYSTDSGSNFPVGTTNVIVTVTDRTGKSMNCSFPIKVDYTPVPVNVAPSVEISHTSGQLVGDSIVISATAVDSDGAIASWLLNFGGTLSNGLGDPPTTFNRTFAGAGTYDVTLTVTDNQGATAAATIQIQIQAAPAVNQYPIASLGLQSGFYAGDAFVFNITASDPDGSIANWTLNYGDGSQESGSGTPPTTRSHVYTLQASRTAELTVTDNQGAVTSKTLQVSVNAVPAPSGHPYFDALIARGDHWKSYHLRSAAQMTQYKATTGRPEWVTYDQAQDAAKVTIPDYDTQALTTVAAAVAPGDTQIKMSASDGSLSGSMTNGRKLKIGSEVVVVVRQSGVPITNQLVTVTRAQDGTTGENHAVGTAVYPAAVSLLNILKLPLGTQDNHTYFFTWDEKWDPSFLFDVHQMTNYKTYQFTCNDGLWGQIDTRFDGKGAAGVIVPGFNNDTHIGAAGARIYTPTGGPATWVNDTQAGPNVNNIGFLSPAVGTFLIRPNVWTRHWVKIEQRANDYDLFSMWVADANNNPVQIFNQLQVNVKTSGIRPNSIDFFWLEFNTSANFVPAGRGYLYAWVRNFVALQDPVNTDALLVTTGL